jgi:hypothetical protein
MNLYHPRPLRLSVSFVDVLPDHSVPVLSSRHMVILSCIIYESGCHHLRVIWSSLICPPMYVTFSTILLIELEQYLLFAERKQFACICVLLASSQHSHSWSCGHCMHWYYENHTSVSIVVAFFWPVHMSSWVRLGFAQYWPFLSFSAFFSTSNLWSNPWLYIPFNTVLGNFNHSVSRKAYELFLICQDILLGLVIRESLHDLVLTTLKSLSDQQTKQLVQILIVILPRLNTAAVIQHQWVHLEVSFWRKYCRTLVEAFEWSFLSLYCLSVLS